MNFLRVNRFVCSLIIATFLLTALAMWSTPVGYAQESSDTDTVAETIFLPMIGDAGNVAAAEDGPAFLEGTDRIIVRYDDGIQAAGIDAAAQVSALSAAAGRNVAYVRPMSGNAIVVELSGWVALEEAAEVAKAMERAPGVAYAEPDQIMQIAQTPNDPNYAQQWHYFTPSAGQYGANLPGAWDITTGSQNTVVAVIDTGILNHADLAGRTVPGYDFINDSLVANDGDGRDNDPSDPGDWITNQESRRGYFRGCPVGDSSWHGTHVAGTIAANSNNGLGVAGINWQAKILAVRVLGKCGGYTSDIVDGIRWAAGLSVTGVPNNANPAKVINMSLGGSGSCSSTYQSAINAAVNAGTVVAVAAGNSNANAANYSPASCANVISVASTGPTGNRAYYSNYGATVEISAPGGDKSNGASDGVLSTLNTGTTSPVADSYEFYQGTSMATPHVAGIVSLLFAVDPSLTPAEVLSVLQSTVTPFPGGSSCNTSICGPGIINAAAAVAAVNGTGGTPPGSFAKSAPANGTTLTGTSTTVSWGSSSGADSYEYCVDTSNNNSCDTGWVSVGSATSAALSSLADDTTYYWQVQASNTTGTIAASGGWWSFSTPAGSGGTAPAAFNKQSPSNGATNVNRWTSLQWQASSGATSYEYCYDTTNNNSCNNWQPTTSTQVSLPRLDRSTTYYWQVRAVNGNGTTVANGNHWSFTTR